MATLQTYLQKWRPNFSETKTVSFVFHLTNTKAKRELAVELSGKLLPFSNTPKYLGITLNKSLTYRRHLEALRKKLSTTVSLTRRLAGALILRTAALALVYSTAKYWAPVWCRSAHTRLIDLVITNALRIVTGCLLPTPTDNLTVLYNKSLVSLATHSQSRLNSFQTVKTRFCIALPKHLDFVFFLGCVLFLAGDWPQTTIPNERAYNY